MTTETTPGYIGPDLVLSGRLTGEGEIEIEGRLEGEVNIVGSVTVGDGGEVHAPVAAGTVDVAGRLRGSVHAYEEVAVRDGGHLEGDVRAPRVGIDDGGVLCGGIDMEFDLPDQAGPDQARLEDTGGTA